MEYFHLCYAMKTPTLILEVMTLGPGNNLYCRLGLKREDIVVFRTTYERPLYLNGGGGTIYGLCAMEVLNIMLSEEEFAYPKKVSDYAPGVEVQLRKWVLSVNDQTEDRAERSEIWSLLPALIGTWGVLDNDQILEYLALCKDRGHLTQYPYYPDGTHSYYLPLEGATKEALEGIISTFWEVAARYTDKRPQEDFTTEQYQRLIRFLDSVPEPLKKFFGPDRHNPSREDREALRLLGVHEYEEEDDDED